MIVDESQELDPIFKGIIKGCFSHSDEIMTMFSCNFHVIMSRVVDDSTYLFKILQKGIVPSKVTDSSQVLSDFEKVSNRIVGILHGLLNLMMKPVLECREPVTVTLYNLQTFHT